MFLVIAAIFLMIVLFIVYDMSKRTTFPGQQKSPAEQEQPQDLE